MNGPYCLHGALVYIDRCWTIGTSPLRINARFVGFLTWRRYETDSVNFIRILNGNVSGPSSGEVGPEL
jgi:hypothetical protein